MASASVSMRENGMNSNTMRVPCSRASAHSCANSSMSLRHGHLGLEEIADLDVARAERCGAFEQHASRDVRGLALLAVDEPVGQEFELEVLDAVIIENASSSPAANAAGAGARGPRARCPGR